MDNEVLAEYLDEHEEYKVTKPLATDVDQFLDLNDSDNEIFIFSCPKQLDPSALKGAKLNISTGKFSLTADGTSDLPPLECELMDQTETVQTMITADNQMRTFGTSGWLHVSQRLPISSNVKHEKVKVEVEPTPLPSNLKERHPFFVDHKAIKLKPYVQTMLEEAASAQNPTAKRKKTSKRSHRSPNTEEVEVVVKKEKRPKQEKPWSAEQEELAWIKAI